MALPNSEKITSQIAILPDAALKQMAMMHKNDPYVLPLIISEDGRRKQMRQAAQAQMAGMPQPKVADAALAQMGQLPEEQGIGQLPAPNIQRMANGGIAGYEDDQEGMATGGMGGMFNFAQQSEPVVRMAGGGMAGDGVMNFSNGGTNKLSGANLFEKALDMEGITNPRERAFLKALHGQESSGKATEKTSNRNAHGAMQILPGTFKEVADKDMDINKPLDNMRAGIRYGKKGYAAAGGDPVLAGAYYYGGPGGMQKAAKGIPVSDPENPKAPTTIDYGNSIAKRMTAMLPIGTAQAGEPPRAAAPDLSSQIPGYSPARSLAPGEKYDVPASTYDQTNSYFGKLADKMGIPLEYQRNIANTANALSGFSAPINTVNRAVGTASRALEATPEMIAKAQQAKQVAETQRLLPPAKAGLEALDEASQATRTAAEAARRARGVEQDVKAAKAAEQSVDAANLTSKIARTTEEAIAAGPNARALDAAKLSNASKALAGTQLAEEKVKGLFPEAARPEVGESVSGNYDKVPPPAEAAPKPSDVIAAAKDAVPAKERKGFGNDDLLMLGLSLLANKSPNFMTALGEAGMQTLGAKKEREKAETDLEYKDIMKKYYGSLGTKAEADASYIASGEKGRMADRQKAAALIDRDLESWRKTMEGTTQPGSEAAKRRELTNYYFGLFGLDVPATMASTAGVAIPEGVKVTRG